METFFTPGTARAFRYSSISGLWLVLRFSQIPGKTHDGRRQADSIFLSLQARRYMFAVGPPRSEICPVKPGTVSRIRSISRTTESSDRFWMIRPSCSVMEQKVHPPKQPRWIVTENL